MPNYHYRCVCGNEFETYQSIKADPLKHCEACGCETLERVIHAVPICTTTEPKTLGHLADRNRDNMGKYEYQEKNAKLEERGRRGRRQISDEAKAIKKKWGMPDVIDPSLATLTPKQQKEFLAKGTVSDA